MHRKFFHKMDGIVRLCVWGGYLLTTSKLWDILESRMPRKIFQGVQKISRVIQQSGLTRFDLYVRADLCEEIRSWLNEDSGDRFFCRQHLQMTDRPALKILTARQCSV
jgi:hypothetical protein